MRLRLVVEGGSAVRKAMADLKDDISGVENSLKSLRRERDAAIKAEGEEASKVKDLNARIQDEQKRLESLTERHKAYERQLKVNNMTMAELRKHLRNTQAALDRVVPGTKNWKTLNAEVQVTRQRLAQLRGTANATSKAMSALTKAAGIVTAGIAAIRGIARVLSGAVNTMKDFEQANANLSTILGKNVNDIQALTKSAMELGRTTEYTASQVTQLQTELAKLGFSESQIQAMQEPVLHFATAVGADLPEAAALAGATLRIFGLRASDTDKTLATLALATNKSALDFSFLQSAMSTVGPVANAFGLSVQDTTALLGALANAGFDASTAATATRNILLNLADGSGKLAIALGGPVRTFPELMDGLTRLNSAGVDLNTTLELTDKRSVAAFNAFLNGVDAANELHDAIGDTDGALKKIADERMNTLEGSIKLLQSAWEGLILSFKNSTGILKSTTDWLTLLVQSMTPGNEERQKMETAYQEAGAYVKAYHDDVLKYGKDVAKARLLSLIDEADNSVRSASDRQWNKDTKENRERLNKAVAHIDALRAALDLIEKEEAADADPIKTVTGDSGGSGSDDDKSKKQWTLQSDEAFLKARAKLTRQYNEGELASKEEYEEKLYQLEVSSLTARLATGKEKGAERAKLEEQLQTTIYKHKVAEAEAEKKLQEEAKALLMAAETDKTKAALAAEDDRYNKEVEKWNKRKMSEEERAQVMETIEKVHRQKLAAIRMQAEENSLKKLKQAADAEKAAIAANYAEELATASSDRAKSIRNKMNAERARVDLVYLQAVKAEYEKIVAAGAIDGEALTDEQLDKYRQEINRLTSEIASVLQTLRGQKQKSTGAPDPIFGMAPNEWDALIAHIREGKMETADWMKVIEGTGNATNSMFSLWQQGIEVVNAKQQKEFDDWKEENDKKQTDLKKRLDNGLISQEQYNSQIEKLQEEEDSKSEALELEQANRARKMAIWESIINTALAVSKQLASYAMPYALIPAGIAAAMGAAQTAMIAAKPIGYAAGGYTDVERLQDGRNFRARRDGSRRGYIDSPTLLVGEEGGEYVIPADGVRNPSLAPVLRTIETARRRGTLKSLNLSAAYPAGYAAGGYTSPAPAQTAYQAAAAGNEALTAVLTRLAERLESPIAAEVSMLGRRGLVESMENYQNLRNNGNL